MDTAKANKVLVPYLVEIIQKSANKKFNYNMGMASDASKHAQFMASQGKVVNTPANLLYCNENLGKVAVSRTHAKIGLLKIVRGWFKDEKAKQKILKGSEMGIGIAVVNQKEDKLDLYVALRIR